MRTSRLPRRGPRPPRARPSAPTTARRVPRVSAAPSASAMVERVRTPARAMSGARGSGPPVARAMVRDGRSTPAAAALPGSVVRGLHSMNSLRPAPSAK